MKVKVIGAHHEARTRLLEEGMRSYLEATTAIIAFEREVQKKCKELLEKHIDDYANALRIPGELAAAEIREHLAPTSEKFDGLWRSVGAAIEGKQFEPSVKWWGTYCALVWEDQQCYAHVGDWIGGPRTKSDHLFQRFQKLGADVYHNAKEVSLYQILTPQESGEFEEPLERVLQQWIELWRKAGGIKGVFPP